MTKPNLQFIFRSWFLYSRSAQSCAITNLKFCTISDSKVGDRTFKKMRGTGDKGQSGLFTGERRWKDDRVFEALGTVDELSSSLGVVRRCFEKEGFFEICNLITEIQCCLQDMGAHLATPASSARPAHQKRTNFDESHADRLDALIDDYSKTLPPLTRFVLPGGSEAACFAHVSRSMCRKAERRVTPLIRESEADIQVQRYLNRLSDLLFVFARFSCKSTNVAEISYKKPRHSGSNVDEKPTNTTKTNL